jgi:hypothetical protein
VPNEFHVNEIQISREFNMRTRLLPALAVCALGMTPAAVQAQIKVEPDKENVVASRLEGDWVLDAALTKRLTKNDGNAEGGRAISFKSDPSVVENIPAKYHKYIANHRIYLAGTVIFREAQPRAHVFLLIEHRGNPHVAWFRDRRGEPLGDTESFNVMLAVAREPQDDLLFIGGDFNNQPFSAYTRLKPAKKK